MPKLATRSKTSRPSPAASEQFQTTYRSTISTGQSRRGTAPPTPRRNARNASTFSLGAHDGFAAKHAFRTTNSVAFRPRAPLASSNAAINAEALKFGKAMDAH